MRKVLFLDRDGVINKDVSYLYKISDLEWVYGAKEALAYAYSKGYDLIVVTNQSGVARGYYKESDVQILHDHMAHELDRSGAPILHFYYCPHHKEGAIPLYAIDCDVLTSWRIEDSITIINKHTTRFNLWFKLI